LKHQNKENETLAYIVDTIQLYIVVKLCIANHVKSCSWS